MYMISWKRYAILNELLSMVNTEYFYGLLVYCTADSVRLIVFFFINIVENCDICVEML